MHVSLSKIRLYVWRGKVEIRVAVEARYTGCIDILSCSWKKLARKQRMAEERGRDTKEICLSAVMN